MARLYYEKSNILSLTDETPPPPQNLNNYLEKVAQLIPSEVIAGYLTMVGFVSSIKNENTRDISLWVVLCIGLVLTPLYLNHVATPGKPKRNHLIISTLAFLVWSYVITGEELLATIYPANQNPFEPALASIILVAFSLISAIMPMGDKKP